MKKIFVLAVILGLVLVGCEDDGSGSKDYGREWGGNADIIGTWVGIIPGWWKYLELNVTEESWQLNGYCDGYEIRRVKRLYNGKEMDALEFTGYQSSFYAVLSGINLYLFDMAVIGLPEKCTLYNEAAINKTTLKIQNESSFYIYYISWQGMFFIDYDNPIDIIFSGDNVNYHVNADSGYIFFNTSKGYCRTNEIVTVKNNENKVFIINNNTLVVNYNNEIKPLGSL
jgi:hypothetical protein